MLACPNRAPRIGLIAEVNEIPPSPSALMRRGAVEKLGEQPPQRPALRGRQAGQIARVDGLRLGDQGVAQRSAVVGEVDAGDSPVDSIGGAGDEPIADHAVDGPHHRGRLDRHDPRQLRLAQAVARPEEQENRPLTNADADRPELLRQVMGHRAGQPVHQVAQALLDGERLRVRWGGVVAAFPFGRVAHGPGVHPAWGPASPTRTYPSTPARRRSRRWTRRKGATPDGTSIGSGAVTRYVRPRQRMVPPPAACRLRCQSTWAPNASEITKPPATRRAATGAA